MSISLASLRGAIATWQSRKHIGSPQPFGLRDDGAGFSFVHIFFYIGVLFSSPSNAMVSDGIHSNKDYVNLAREHSAFESACSIYDSRTNISQSGVLIAPNIVATAAHGIASILNKTDSLSSATTLVSVNGVRVTFDVNGYHPSYEVESVLIDSRYLNNILGIEAKYDIALVKLKENVKEISPAKTFNSAEIPSNSPLYVVTFGNIDQSDRYFSKRAFMLFEMDSFFSSPFDDEVLELNRSVLISSLFFKPDETLKKPTINADEITSRTYEATQNWIAQGRKPYGLALPGTSGAPVFVTLTINGKKEDFLFGLVTSFAHLSGKFRAPKGQAEHKYILENTDKVFGQYQTIFALFYQEDSLPLNPRANTKMYKRDRAFSSLLTQLQGYNDVNYRRSTRKTG